MKIDSETSAKIKWSFDHDTSTHGMPAVTRPVMVSKYGEEETERLIAIIQSLIDQTNRIEPEIDWTRMNLAEGQKFMENALQSRNPGLSKEAANWIARYFGFQMR